MKKTLAMLLSLLMLGSLLTGCGKTGNDPGSSESPAQESETSETVRTDVNTSLWTDVTTLDPQMSASAYDMAIIYQIYDSLFAPTNGDYNDLTYCLCDSYEVDEASMVYTFHIRQGVLFHNGDTLTVDDVVFSLERMRNSPATASRVSFVTEVEKVDEENVRVTCAYPSPRLPALLSTASMTIVNKALIEQYGDSAPETVVGTGAYKLESWKPGEGIVLTAFEEGWRGVPKIETINYNLISDSNASRIAFQTGALDFYYAASWADVEEFRDNEDYNTFQYSMSTTDNLVFNTSRTDSWISNEQFRIACAYAINRADVAQVVTDGLCNVSDSMVASGNIAYDNDWVYPYEYNPEKAKEILEEIGYDGSPVGLLYTSSYTSSAAFGTTVEAYLRAVGINVDMQGQDYANVVSRLTNFDYDICVFEYSVSYPDPLTSFYTLYRSDGYYNVFQYYNDELDAQIISLYGATNDKDLAAGLQAIDQMALNSAFYIPIYVQGGYGFMPKNLINRSAAEPMFGWSYFAFFEWLTDAELEEYRASLA